MNTFEHLLHVVLNFFFRKRDIVIDGHLYLRRWYLWFGKNKRVFLHCIIRADDQRVLHDHPWAFQTFILARGYLERLPGGHVRAVRRFRHLKHEATHLHAVDPAWGPAWTLMVAEKPSRLWGFQPETGWQHWRAYLNEWNTPDHPEDIIDYTDRFGSLYEARVRLMKSASGDPKEEAQRAAMLTDVNDRFNRLLEDGL